MKRIRLQVQIMPWQLPGPTPSAAQARQEAIIKWCEPCTEDLTIQGLTDKILDRWARVYVGFGSLKIRRLESAYGETLDMIETVGAYFDDRKDFGDKLATNEVPPTSIVQVFRYPPDPSEHMNHQRFGSLMPESTARPRKRPLAVFTQDSPNSPRAAASIEERDDELPHGTFAAANKRQRTYDGRVYGSFNPDQPGVSREDQQEGTRILSQTSGTQGSIHQVFDSQIAPGRRQPNPYGTPTSLSLVSPQDHIPGHQNDITSVPDSPPSRRATINLERERTKSESPEIRLSVHDVPPTPAENGTAVDPIEIQVLDTLPISLDSISTSQSKSGMQMVDEPAETNGFSHEQRIDDAHDAFDATAQPDDQPVGRTWNRVARIDHGSLRHSEQIYDEIESDTESFHEKQRMHSAKRLKSNHTNSERPFLPRLSKDRKDGKFLIPSIPRWHENGARIPLGDLGRPGRQDSVATTNRDINDPQGQQQHPDKSRGSQLLNGLDDNQSGQTDVDKLTLEQPFPEESAANDGSADVLKSSSQATTIWSQGWEMPAKNWRDLDLEHPLKQALSQGKKPDLTTLVSSGERENSRNQERAPEAKEIERLAKDPEGHQEKRTRAEKPEKPRLAKEAKETRKEAVSAEQASQDAEPGAAESETEDIRVAEKQKTCEGRTGAEQLIEAAMVTQSRAKEEENVPANAIKETKSKVKRLGDKRKNDETVARDRASREKALSEQAEKRILEADGAKQLEVEKRQKQKTPTSSKRETTATETPGPTKRERTPAQKARRVELAAKRKIEVAQAADVKSGKSWADKLFQDSNEEERKSRERTPARRNEEETRKRQVKPNCSGRDVQKLKGLSEDRSRQASTSSETGSAGGQMRKSLTPALPRPSVTKSSSTRGGPPSSSPLASRSSAYADTPLRSALKQVQTSSALRRSVSFVNDQGTSLSGPNIGVASNSPAVNEIPSVSRPTKSLVEINNELAFTTPSASTFTKTAQARDISNKKSARKFVAKEMVQQKLNVTRDKKMKGRAVDPPIPSGATPKNEIALPSSDGDSASSFSSDEEDRGNGSCKAGPSSRKKATRAVPSQHNTAVRTNQLPIDPALENTKTNSGRSATLDLIRRSKSTSDVSSDQKSNSRSPAQAMSETISVSSGSTSGSESESDSGADSVTSKDVRSAPAKTPSNTEIGQRTTSNSSGSSEAGQVGIEFSDKGSESSQAVKSTQMSLASSKGFAPMRTNAKNVDEAAGEQLQLECDQSAPTRLTIATPSTGNGSSEHDKLLNQGLNRHGRLPDGTRPAYFKYPKLSTLRKVAEMTSEESPSAQSASQNSAVAPAQHQETSSSSSDEDSSNSEDDEDDEQAPTSPSGSRTSSKSKSGGIPGLRNVIKLARKARLIGTR